MKKAESSLEENKEKKVKKNNTGRNQIKIDQNKQHKKYLLEQNRNKFETFVRS